MVKKKEKQICMGCIIDFDEKDVYWILITDHKVLHCLKCIKEKGIKEYEPYILKKK